MDECPKKKIWLIIDKNMNKAIDDIQDEDVGYWPDDCSAMTDAAASVLYHQIRIDEYHKKEGTSFLPCV